MKGFHTTSVLIDNDILLDAGTGAGLLDRDDIFQIKDVLITHSHLDHVASLCFLVDHDIEAPSSSLSIYCLPHTAKMIRENLINGKLWPEIERIVINGVPMLEIKEITPFQEIDIKGRRFTPLAVDHVVPTVAYALHGDKHDFVYVADMYDAPQEFWEWLRCNTRLKYMVIESAFPNSMDKIARLSKHLTPNLLAECLERLGRDDISLYAAHLKPMYFEKIADELQDVCGGRVNLLKSGMVFEF